MVTTSPTYDLISLEARVTVVQIYLYSFGENSSIAPTDDSARISAI